MHLDLDDWLRGERDWRDLFEFAARLRNRAGSAYSAALLQDPDIVEALAAAADDEDTTPSIEGFDPVISRLAAIEDRLTQLLWATAKADPSTAPTVPRPQYPHLALREERRRFGMDSMISILTGGD